MADKHFLPSASLGMQDHKRSEDIPRRRHAFSFYTVGRLVSRVAGLFMPAVESGEQAL